MKASQLINGIITARYPQSITMPNYTPKHWWECDVFELMKSGYWYEYEVKVSRSDFRADALKNKHIPELTRKYNPEWAANHPEGFKHDILAGSCYGPNRFYFVTLSGIVAEKEIPEWAGWYETYAESSDRPRVRVVQRKPAPLRHKVKVDPKISDHLKTCAYHRFMRFHIQTLRGKGAA